MAKKGTPQQSTGLSRRDFFRNSAAGALTTGLIAQDHSKAQGAGGMRVYGPGKVPVELNVNGKLQKLQLEPRVTLLDALRNELDVTGAKKVCDRGSCGACTVLLDGKAVYACSVLAIDAQGLRIETVEGLGTPDKLHPVQKAFVANDALQCGFCTPGFVVASKALLDRNPNPTMAEVERGLSGNICRCGTYVGIRKAVLQAAKGGSNA